MKRPVLAAFAFIASAAFAQSPAAVPVPSPNRIPGAQAAASPQRGGAPSISAGPTNNPLLLVDSTGKVVGRPEGVAAPHIILLMNGRTTRLSGLLAPDPVIYASSDCSGTPYVSFGFPGVEQSGVVVFEGPGVFNAYVADVSEPPTLLTTRSMFLNGVCLTFDPRPSPAHPVSIVVPASSFGTPPFHLE